MKSNHATNPIRPQPAGRPVSRRTFCVATGLFAFGALLGFAFVHGSSSFLVTRSAPTIEVALPDGDSWFAAYSAYDAPSDTDSPVQAHRGAARGAVRAPEVLPPDAVLKLPDAPLEVRRLINEVAAEVKIAPALLHAVIATESRYNSDALSPRGAIGLMQLMPETALRFGAPDPYNPRDNVLAGANYLKFLLKLFGNDVELVLAAYNAGHNAVLRAGNRIPEYPETQAYVPKVLAYMRCASSAACRPT